MPATYSPCSAVAVQSVPEWREWSTHPALRPWVLGYWQHVVREGTHTIRTLPDGCVDVTCDLSRVDVPIVYVAGPQREPATYDIVAPTRLFGARLHPLAATHLIGPYLAELAGVWWPLERFIGEPAVELSKRIASVDEAQAAAVFDAFFFERLVDPDVDWRLTQSLAAIFARQGRVTVAELACIAGATDRTLRRMFETQVGLTPKRLARIVRMQAALQRVQEGTDWARIASELGYADQAHLCREMNQLAGDSPARIVRQRLAPTDPAAEAPRTPPALAPAALALRYPLPAWARP